MDKNIGRKLDGRYEITELIGIGGMADVYKAVDLAEDRTVAVKILKNEFADNDEFVRRFRNESKAIAVLSHPNIVKIYDVGFSGKIQFIVMEYIDGITLKEFMEQQGVLKWKDSVHFIVQILRALQHAHDRGIVHRDIKPQNIMLFPDGTIKVMDFGIARFAREEGKTISNKAIGSVHYISPEQASGDFTDEKSDIYSVGVMLYEMLTGVKPFDADTPIAVALMHMQQNPKPPREINNTIPEGLEAIVLRAMQRDASRRYQSASEMIKDIEEFKRNPSIVFEYHYPQSSRDDENDGKTRYFSTPPAAVREQEPPKGPRFKEDERGRSEKNEVRKTKLQKTSQTEYDEDYDEDDEEEEEVSKSSYFIVALTAIAAAVIIIVVVFITIVILRNLPTKVETQAMVNLVGHEYQYCKSTYAEYFDLVLDGEKYDPTIPKGYIISHTPKEGAPVIVGNTQVKAVVSKGPQMVNVPNVYSLEANTAESMIRNAGLKSTILMQYSDADKNTVIMTEPARNESVQIDSTVIVYVSLGPEIYDQFVPDVVGLKKAEAVKMFEDKGFKVQLQAEDSSEEEDVVIAQSIPAFTESGEANIVSPDQTVILTYSSGEAPQTEVSVTFAVPDGLRGKAVFNAYVNGNLSGNISFDNIGYVSTVSVPVTGMETQKVILEAVDESGEANIIGEYTVDFAAKTVSAIKFDSEMLRNMFGTPDNTAVAADDPFGPDITFSDPAGDISDPEIIGGGESYEDWWNSIIRSY
ncbi:MAG: Stk1 family PASTA domain-containing Ser/Thr kinase [Ruminococcus sp.]|nr:Stk1 family PASTA domain-containing Ser/Thr kinase [Ruminococcus sp.]